MTILSLHPAEAKRMRFAEEDELVVASMEEGCVVCGVDTHKDLPVAAVVDHRDQVLGGESFPVTRQGHRRMLNWMRTFGELQRVGVECSGSYGAGPLRHLQTAGVEVLEVMAADKHDRRRRGKNGAFDAESAAHSAFARRRDGLVESLRVPRVCRSEAEQASVRGTDAPPNGHPGAPHCPADDPDDDRLRSGKDPRSSSQHGPHAADPHAR